MHLVLKNNVCVVSLGLQYHSKAEEDCILKKNGGGENMVIVSQFSRCSLCSVTDYTALMSSWEISYKFYNIFFIICNMLGYGEKNVT